MPLLAVEGIIDDIARIAERLAQLLVQVPVVLDDKYAHAGFACRPEERSVGGDIDAGQLAVLIDADLVNESAPRLAELRIAGQLVARDPGAPEGLRERHDLALFEKLPRLPP